MDKQKLEEMLKGGAFQKEEAAQPRHGINKQQGMWNFEQFGAALELV